MDRLSLFAHKVAYGTRNIYTANSYTHTSIGSTDLPYNHLAEAKLSMRPYLIADTWEKLFRLSLRVLGIISLRSFLVRYASKLARLSLVHAAAQEPVLLQVVGAGNELFPLVGPGLFLHLASVLDVTCLFFFMYVLVALVYAC